MPMCSVCESVEREQPAKRRSMQPKQERLDSMCTQCFPSKQKHASAIDAPEALAPNPPPEGDITLSGPQHNTSETALHPSTRTPVVLCVAPNGARRTPTDHPALPLTGPEIAREASRCMEAGASVIHLHVRDRSGAHTLDVDQYKDVITQVKSAVRDHMVIQVTTEAVGRYQPQEQMAVVRTLRPTAASVALRELVPDETHLSQASAFFVWAATHGVALQFIVYSPDEAVELQALARRGALGCDSPNTLFVLGRYTAGQRSQATDLLPFLADWPSTASWSVCAFGPTEAQCATAAIGLGGHARVGFENNLFDASGSLADHNAQLVSNVADVSRRSGRGVATADQARSIFGVTQA